MIYLILSVNDFNKIYRITRGLKINAPLITENSTANLLNVGKMFTNTIIKANVSLRLKMRMRKDKIHKGLLRKRSCR